MSQKISILDVKEVVDFPLRLLGDLFQRYLSVKHIGYLVTHGKSESCEGCHMWNNGA